MRKAYSKLTIKTAERRHRRCPIFFIVNFKYISHIVLVFALLAIESIFVESVLFLLNTSTRS